MHDLGVRTQGVQVHSPAPYALRHDVSLEIWRLYIHTNLDRAFSRQNILH